MGNKRSKKRRRLLTWNAHRAPTYAPPGTLTVDPAAAKPNIQLIAYGPDKFIHEHIADPHAITSWLNKHPVTWVNVDGLGDIDIIKTIGDTFGLHRLALEDVVHVGQRPKVDEYENHLYIVARMIDRANGRLGTEQLSMFLGKNFVLTFQERPGDCLDAIRARAREKRGRVRDAGADYLAYAILDAVVDEYYPVLESEGDKLEAIEEEVLARPKPGTATAVHVIRRDLLVLRRAIWPLREAANSLQRGTSMIITPETRIYLRDLYDHTVQVLDLVEVYRELCNSLQDMYTTSISHRMNEVIRLLTIISTIFIPLTFIAGIYGMNFDPDSSPLNMPELRWAFGYPFALLVMGVVATGMLFHFWRKGWLGGAVSNSAAGGADNIDDNATRRADSRESILTDEQRTDRG